MNKDKQNESETKNKVKIIHILQSAGGVAEYVKDLLRNMNDECFENIVIGSNDYLEQEEITKVCDKVFYVDMVREISVKKDIKGIFQIQKIVKQEKPDILYLHSSKAGALGRIATFFNRKVKVIYNPHGWYFNAEIGNKKSIFKFIEKILAYRADKIIAISKHEYDSAIENHICREEKIVLIENGIDIKKYVDYDSYRKKMREKYKITEDSIVVGVVGRLSEQKDPITTIKAASKVINKYKKIYFIFVGAGELEEKVLKYAKEHKIDSNIIITGWVDNVKEYISAFDIAILPSKWEGFGLAILEYMICKKPIITTGIGGISDIISEQDNAIFIKKEDSEDLANKIINIVKGEIDMSYAIEKNYERCKFTYSIERVVEQTEKVLKDLVKRRGGVLNDKK